MFIIVKKFVSLLLLLGIIVSPTSINAAPNNNLTMYSNRVIVSISSDNAVSTIKSKLPQADVKVLKNGQAVVYSNSLSSSEISKKLSSVKEIKSIKKPDRMKLISPVGKVLMSQTYKNYQTSKQKVQSLTSYEWDLSSTNTLNAWSLLKQQKVVKVAVVDTGVDYTHPALQGKVDTANGYNFVANTTNVMDDNGHGTHVSGIIATNSAASGGLLGITGNANVQILPVKVLDSSGSGDSDVIARGIIYAADKGVDVINLSLGGRGVSPEINNAVQYAVQKNVAVVAAAGNDSADTQYYSPASSLNVITVSAITQYNTRSYYSNYGAKLDVAAPGDNILSTYPGNRYAFMSGTSMAAPIVSGVVALMKAQKPTLTPAQIKSILDSSASDLGQPGKDRFYGYGKVNTLNAIKVTSSTK